MAERQDCVDCVKRAFVNDSKLSEDTYRSTYSIYYDPMAAKVTAGYEVKCQQLIARESYNYLQTLMRFGMKLLHAAYDHMIHTIKIWRILVVSGGSSALIRWKQYTKKSRPLRESF